MLAAASIISNTKVTIRRKLQQHPYHCDTSNNNHHNAWIRRNQLFLYYIYWDSEIYENDEGDPHTF